MSAGVALAVALAAVLFLGACPGEPGEGRRVTSLSYRGHEQDADIDRFVGAYPEATGSRLDDCVLCHTDGDVPDGRGGKATVNACDYCHAVRREGRPYSITLNPFGRAYFEGGRDESAFGRIAGEDSDGDGFSNAEEIGAGSFPGRETSHPGNPPAPYVELTLEELRALESHQQFMLMNSHRERCDAYVTYRGVRISALLRSVGVDVAGIEGVTVFAPDGYAKTYTREQVTREYPAGPFRAGLDDAGLGMGRGIVVYPERTPHGELPDRGLIPGKLFLLLAYERDFEPLSVSVLDPLEGKIRGEGPYRTVRPQEVPSGPDRGSRHVLGDAHDYDDSLDHNAGDGVRGVTVIRVDPMPAGHEEFDARNASWRLLARGKLVLYGYGIE